MPADGLILLIPAPPRPTDLRVRLPETGRNIFDRIIRDPKAPNRPARERLCTEMLCAVLANAPTVREAALRWLTKLAGIDYVPLANLDWDFDTERAIGAKRDDLRIEGWRRDESSARPTVLWTIEVKVSAPLHFSSDQTDDDEEAAQAEITVEEIEQVSQLVNYDRWLFQQDAHHRAGFVLAVTDFSAALPDGLTMPWHATTWAQLAQIIEGELADDKIAVSERILAEHFAGFVRDHLWSDPQMTSDRIEFDDLAILRAFAIRGAACFRKTNALVASLKDTLASAKLPFVSVTAHHALRGPNTRSAINGKLLPDRKSKPIPPSLFAGIVGGEARVWLESSPNSPAKQLFSQLCEKYIASLQARNANWIAESSKESWPDLTLSKRLDFLLAVDDQASAIKNFVTQALDDLEVTGFTDQLRAIIEQLKIND